MLDDGLGSGKQIDIEQSSTIQQLSIRIENNIDKCLINMNMTVVEDELQKETIWFVFLLDEVVSGLILVTPPLSAAHYSK